MSDILKELYSDGWERPAWAKVALKFGWIVSGEYYAIEPTRAARSRLHEAMYRRFPMFGLIRKTG